LGHLYVKKTPIERRVFLRRQDICNKMAAYERDVTT